MTDTTVGPKNFGFKAKSFFGGLTSRLAVAFSAWETRFTVPGLGGGNRLGKEARFFSSEVLLSSPLIYRFIICSYNDQ